MATRFDWQGLEKKISLGKDVETSAKEMGIPLQDAKDYLQAKREADDYDKEEAQIVSRSVLEESLVILRELLQDADPFVRLRAAAELRKHYSFEKSRLEKRFLNETAKGPNVDPGQQDIFGDWKLKDPKNG